MPTPGDFRSSFSRYRSSADYITQPSVVALRVGFALRSRLNIGFYVGHETFDRIERLIDVVERGYDQPRMASILAILA